MKKFEFKIIEPNNKRKPTLITLEGWVKYRSSRYCDISLHEEFVSQRLPFYKWRLERTKKLLIKRYKEDGEKTRVEIVDTEAVQIINKSKNVNFLDKLKRVSSPNGDNLV